MSRIVPVHYRKVMQVLESEGFTFARERGDHLIFNKPGSKRPVVLPRYNPVPVFIIVNVLRTDGISRERYLELLGRE